MGKKKRILLACVIAALIAVVACQFIPASYPAGMLASEALQSDAQVAVVYEESYIVFSPEEPEIGFVFYPGGRVEHSAYAPLLRLLAEKNILCILMEMPLDLAILDMYAAEDIPEKFPHITDWYMGGHSLGGSSACYHLEKTEDDYRGLVLLASYSSVDLSGQNLAVCSLYGAQDGVLNMERYQESKSNLPSDFAEYIITGGNHSQFADYGHQNKDGTAGITLREQLEITADYLLAFFEE